MEFEVLIPNGEFRAASTPGFSIETNVKDNLEWEESQFSRQTK